MYTRCPSCSSTFRVTATVLQMAGGEVRCGSCSAVFNALHTLVDDWTAIVIKPPGASPPSLPEAPPESGQRPADSDGDEPVAETLEFDVPETEWQRFFITPPQAPAPLGAAADPGLGENFDDPAAPATAAGDTAAAPADEIRQGEDTLDEPGPPRSLEEETADTDTWKAFLRATEPDADDDNRPLYVVGDDDLRPADVRVLVRRLPETQPPAPDAPEIEPETGLLYATQPGEARDTEPADPVPGDDAGPDREVGSADNGEPAARPRRPPAIDTVLDWGPPPAFPEPAMRPPAHSGRWLAASAVAALALAAQAANYSRDALAADPGYGAIVRDVYGRLGVPLHPAWPLDGYEIRGAKAIAENSAPGALDIVAEIAVTGPQPVGLPLVRVLLRDRWSNAVASGVFDAASYLAEAAPASRVYAPGTLIPVQISLKDPGSAAQGYELDVCVPNRHLGLQCKSERDPFRR